jgi:hypothetical protein
MIQFFATSLSKLVATRNKLLEKAFRIIGLGHVLEELVVSRTITLHHVLEPGGIIGKLETVALA